MSENRGRVLKDRLDSEANEYGSLHTLLRRFQ